MLALMVVLACGRGEQAPIEPSASQDGTRVDAVVGEPFTLRVGQTADVRGTGLVVAFVEVSADSRCPTDVDCVWAGSARVALRAAGRDVELNTGEPPRSAQLGEYLLELRSLAPLPKSDAPIQPASYIATLLVTRPGT